VPTKGPGAGMDMDVAEPKYMSSATYKKNAIKTDIVE
jgi:hypothetical protein